MTEERKTSWKDRLESGVHAYMRNLTEEDKSRCRKVTKSSSANAHLRKWYDLFKF